jgi:hypothetical protein
MSTQELLQATMDLAGVGNVLSYDHVQAITHTRAVVDWRRSPRSLVLSLSGAWAGLTMP